MVYGTVRTAKHQTKVLNGEPMSCSVANCYFVANHRATDIIVVRARLNAIC